MFDSQTCIRFCHINCYVFDLYDISGTKRINTLRIYFDKYSDINPFNMYAIFSNLLTRSILFGEGIQRKLRYDL